MIKQNPISLQIPIIPGKEKELRAVLNQGGPNNPLLIDPLLSKFQTLKHLHFSRFVIAPKQKLSTGKEVPASLIYAANVDGKGEDHLKAIAKILTEELRAILVNCEDFNPKADAAGIYQYLQNYEIGTPGFYVGAPNRSVQQVQAEAQFQFDVQDFVKENGDHWNTSNEAYMAIKDWIAKNPDRWPELRKDYKLPKKSWLKLIFLAVFLLSILPLVLFYVLWVQFVVEPRYKPWGININQVPLSHIDEMMSTEDVVYQNQLSQVFETKRGLRRLGLRFFLWATTKLGKWFFVDGQLLGTPTIHFARWVIIDGGDRFVFFSNFDGSYDMYLGDFVDNSGWGLNTIYGASVGYPKTLFVFLKGAYQIGQFMGWGRKTQVATQLWYSAYPWQGLQQIVSRSKLRTTLFNTSNPSEKEIKDMLRRI